MSVLAFFACYLAVGVIWGMKRALMIGTHRIEHQGKEGLYCNHWACDVMADDFLSSAVIVAIWPISIPVHCLGRLFKALIAAPYKRSLPPENSIDDVEHDYKRCGCAACESKRQARKVI